ncbi:MAG TPA: hypothetical protein VG148_17870 [Pyrinomonadaceae bacterium]|nr:hypothetical protein [Pyrinomonadaceae bacterium]
MTRDRARRPFLFAALALAVCLVSTPFAEVGAQKTVAKNFRPDTRRALRSRQPQTAAPARKGAYLPQRRLSEAPARRPRPSQGDTGRWRRARPAPAPRTPEEKAGAEALRAAPSSLVLGTPLSRVLHVSQLSLTSDAGTVEQFVDDDRDLVADRRRTFDAAGGSYDIALGRSGARYEAFTAVDERGTPSPSDDVATGVLVVAFDTNGDYVRDSSLTFDLGRDFGLPSAVSVVSGTSRGGREFVVVSSSGYFNSEDPGDPNNEPSPGVVLLVRDPFTGGFDASRSRRLVRVGDDRLFNANGMALLPSGDLLIADFASNELRVVRDTDGDLVPDTLAAAPYHSFPFAEDAPLDVAANSRGVVFTHGVGNDTYLLAVYDGDRDGFADADDIRVEGLSIDNNLVLHGLTVGRDGTVYLIQDATGESDRPADGGNGGIPHVQAFPDPALNGILRDGSAFVLADDEFTQAYSGLSFGVETVLPPVGRLSLANSASLVGGAPRGGLATIRGANLTRGRSGATREEALARGVSVTLEGVAADVLSFNDSQVHIYVPKELGVGVATVVVSVSGDVMAAEDALVVNTTPGLFTHAQTGTGEAVALLASGNFYTAAPFPARTNNEPSVVALLGTGWRNSLPVTARVGPKAAVVQYAGPSGGFPGLDQINLVIPDGVTGQAPVVITTRDGNPSRAGVFITIQ